MFIFTTETVITFVLVVLFILIKLYCSISDWWKYKDCKHEKISETSACDAVCNNCNKNLGFIGSWRERNKS